MMRTSNGFRTGELFANAGSGWIDVGSGCTPSRWRAGLHDELLTASTTDTFPQVLSRLLA